MFSDRDAAGRTQGSSSRRTAHRLLTALAAALLTMGLLPLAAPTASAATYTITGRVTGLSATGAVVPVPAAAVWAYDATNRFVTSAGPSSDGTYTMTVPTAGPYRLQAGCYGTMTCAPTYGMEWYSDASDFDSATPVSITSTTTPARADIRLDRRSSISGTVRNAAGQPVASTVEISPSGGGQVITVTPDFLGRFTLTGVPAGPSYLSAQASSDDHVYDTVTWNGTASTTSYSTYTVPAGTSVTGVDLVLAPATGVLGTATDTAGTPLRNIGWNLYEFRPAEGDWYGVQAGPLLTDADGEMWWRTEVGKTYKLCFYDTWHDTDWQPTDRYADRCWSSSDPTGSPTLETASPITVTATTRRQLLTVQLPYAGRSLSPVEPFVTGSPAVGGTLTVDPGRWSPAGVALSYQWYASTASGRTPVAGATGPSYVPTSAVSGATLTATVTGTLAGYKTASETAYANVVGARTPTLTSPLTLTGSPVVGGTLTASHGAITPAADYYPSYTWVIDGVPGESSWGSTPPSLTLTSASVGKRIGLRMLASGGGANQLQVSTLSPVIQAGTLTAPTPTISGTKAVGSTLTAVPGTWGPSPVTLTYQWYRSGVAISGATASTYRLTTTDQARTMTVRVTGARNGYLTVARTSAATTAVLGVFTTPTPTISGTRAVASTLTAVVGTWSPLATTSSYQWYRSGVAISGATAKTYKLTTTDKGRYLKVRVTGVRSGYLTKSVYSAQTAAIA